MYYFFLIALLMPGLPFADYGKTKDDKFRIAIRIGIAFWSFAGMGIIGLIYFIDSHLP